MERLGFTSYFFYKLIFLFNRNAFAIIAKMTNTYICRMCKNENLSVFCAFKTEVLTRALKTKTNKRLGENFKTYPDIELSSLLVVFIKIVWYISE